MKKTILILLAVSFVIAGANAKDKKKKDQPAPVKVFSNNVDSMSYALGMNVGADFAKNLKGIPGGKYNTDLIVKGFSTAMKGDSTLMTAEFAAKYFQGYIASAQAKDMDAKKADGEKFLAENKTKPGVHTTASGLQYEILTPAEGPKPQATDSVKVHYQGTLLDGTKFDSSIDRGQPITFPLNQVIPGWTEGVQLMSVGSKYKFYVPYNLGYGEKGAQGAIPPYATLVFEVELLGFSPAKVVEEAPAATTPEPAKAATKAPKATPAKGAKSSKK
ncbi:MAG TPA: FKBP-type peptidyl-prolyl cis-trans isomerase [Paludibacter sp.]|nr:FKBP-type peptidyl-prolyl cis-trans isomerase [Paludibacter sp.]